MNKDTKVFTDGAARGNPGPGGWGVIVQNGNVVKELGGGEAHTTNNRMELSAVIEALVFLKKGSAEINTDSSYVLKGATVWLSGWQKSNWKTKGKKDVLNRDLWERLSGLLMHFSLTWNLLPGHSGIPANERCDVIATSMADNKKIHLYSGSLSSYPVDLSVLVATKQKRSKVRNSGIPYSYVSMVGGVVRIHKTWIECETRVKGAKGAKFKKVFSPEEERALVSEWQNS